MKKLRVILWDQLSESISSLKFCDKKNDVIILYELKNDATYVKHHKKKLVFLFSAMRHFASQLSASGYNVDYRELDDNCGILGEEIKKSIKVHNPDRILVTHPGEYRVLEELKNLQKELTVEIEILSDDRFLASAKDFNDWARGKNSLKMELFYRHLRQKYSILMERNEPIGGKWNYDSENRKMPKDGAKVPAIIKFKPDSITEEVINLVNRHFTDHFGELDNFDFAVTRDQALEVLNNFISFRLNSFGDYQDAMLEDEPFMYHSVISHYINSGLLLPMECIKAAEKAYFKGDAPLNAVEGFIRQILGWREYVRGVYWYKMPGYKKENYFNATRKLPGFFWGVDTKMNCIKQCVKQTKKLAYAHHIQRLMVLGNFALIAGIHPDEVNEWFLVVYADAFEWVEMPNVTGMILFADGGYLASKPYASSGNYINKMSNYCKNCDYDVEQKIGEKACPFNYLYWDFLSRNRKKLENNQRISFMYKTLDAMDEKKKNSIKEESDKFLNALNYDY